jgi:hypothetical protein
MEENKETTDLLSLLIRFVCGISHEGVNYSTNLAIDLIGVLYFGIFFKKLYLLYIGTEGVSFIHTTQHCVPFSPFCMLTPTPEKLRSAWAGARFRPAHLTVGEFLFFLFPSFLVGFYFKFFGHICTFFI